jgi:hypothetical protein
MGETVPQPLISDPLGKDPLVYARRVVDNANALPTNAASAYYNKDFSLLEDKLESDHGPSATSSWRAILQVATLTKP